MPPPSDSDPLRLALDSALGAQYDVLGLLGRGGAGSVYLARERLLERPVAIKVLRRDVDDVASRERFVREARTAARLSHPHIVPLLSFGESGDMLFYVMPHVAGESLETLLRREERLPATDARRILGEIASALAYAHAQGIVHRDIKPDNVLIDRDTGRAMLTDFGIARREAEGNTLTHTGMIVGTPHYMSPEQASGERVIDGRSDLYALGVIGYRMLAGRLPFEGRSVEELLARHATSAPTPLARVAPDAPIDLTTAIARCLEKNPAQRWSDAASLRHALTAGSDDADALPDRLEGLPRFATRCAGLLYISAIMCSVAFAWDFDPVWYEVLGLVGAAFAGAIGHVVWRARSFGVPPAAALRIALWPPMGWSSWWPASLRSRDDIWPRLPKRLRRARTAFGSAMAIMACLVIPLEIGMVIARHHKLLSNVLFGSSMGTALAFVGVIATTAVLTRQVTRGAGLDRFEERKLLIEPTLGSKFWNRPNVARLLAPSGPARPGTPDGLHSVSDMVRSIAMIADDLPETVRSLAKDAVRAANDLASRIAAIDRERQQLAEHGDPAERQRVEERLRSIGQATTDESPAIRQMRDILSSQLALLTQLGQSDAGLRERRAIFEGHIRTLCLQLIRLRDQETVSPQGGQDITGELRALCDAIDRRIHAVVETERVLTG